MFIFQIALVILTYFTFMIGPIIVGARYLEAERAGPGAAFIVSLVVPAILLVAFMLGKIFSDQAMFLLFIGFLGSAPVVSLILGTTLSRSLGLMLIVAAMQIIMLFLLAAIGISILDVH